MCIYFSFLGEHGTTFRLYNARNFYNTINVVPHTSALRLRCLGRTMLVCIK